MGTLSTALHVAGNASIVRKDGRPFFLPPFAAVNSTPYASMIERGAAGSSGASSYANFRYWVETLSSSFFESDVVHAISDFRESHTGTLSGMTRCLDHLDDMPTDGYAYSSMQLARTQPFQVLLFGHAANYHSRGVFNAPEQMSLYGDGVPGLWTYSDSFRAYLKAEDEVDIDFCVPSTTLPATMVRWMILFEERDQDKIALFRTAPCRFFAPGGHTVIELVRGATRFGSVIANVSVLSDFGSPLCPLSARVSIRLDLHGRGYTF